jgi:hypothetical protein
MVYVALEAPISRAFVQFVVRARRIASIFAEFNAATPATGKITSSSPYKINRFKIAGAGAPLELMMSKFDYTVPAELFPSRNRKIANKVKYRRFDMAAEAIRFAVEELPEPLLLGAFIEIEEERLGHKDIRALYESADYPLKRAN